jgi:CoA:oxalate CoA-transferase
VTGHSPGAALGEEGRTAAPLEGLLVLDLGQVYAGPYCAWLLGQLGARIVKVEAPTGDIVRARTRHPRGPYSYLMLNSGKESVVLDLKTVQGRELLLRLVERADVLVENFSVGTLERLGLAPDVLLARNPRLVIASGTGFGLDGPYSGLSAMDVTVQAMSGIISSSGFPDGPPVKSAAAVADFLGAVHLCVGVLAALLQRQQTGQGQQVESSMHEAAVISLCSSISAVYDSVGVPPVRTGNRHPALSVAPYNVYRAVDGYVAVNCPAQSHWIALTALMGRPELADDERYRGPVDRTERMEEVDGLVEAWTSTQPRDELVTQLAAQNIPCAPVLTVPEVLADAHLFERRALVPVDDPGRGPMVLPTSPLRLHGSPAPADPRPAPDLGQHTQSVLAELLSVEQAELDRLAEQGAFGAV